MSANETSKRDAIVAGGVALAAFAASAQHIFHVTAEAGNHPIVAALHPAGIDGLIYIGIRAMQQGRRKAGALAIGYGALYSLTFNAASYEMFKMPAILLAACMPLAMMIGFIIVHSGHAAKVVEPVERIVEKIVAPALLPIVPLQRPALIPAQRAALPKAVATTSARVARWDVEKAVAMLLAGAPNAEIMTVCGVTYKPLQRTAKCVSMLQAGTAPAECAESIPLSLAHVLRVQAAIVDASA